ncbi:hypothetical protein ACFOWM_10620 [Ferruginibacter yonginensis]|uniref:Uncharacterized protein n=1 Tax=Ferruginibacter yonginensis TaxID=1310416 RepID=A0ABV8QT93_9BACT
MFSKTDIENYFTHFKYEQFILISIGIIAFVVAVILLGFFKTIWNKGFALPLAVYGFITAGAGISNYLKIRPLQIRSTYNYDLHPELLKTKELTRLISLQQNYQLLIYVNSAILIAAILIYLYLKNKAANQYYMGVAASLLLVSLLSVVTYIILKQTALPYINGIEQFTKNIIVK